MQTDDAVQNAPCTEDFAAIATAAALMAIAYGVFIFAPHSPVRSLMSFRWEPVSASQEYEAGVWCKWRNADATEIAIWRCKDEMAGPDSGRRIQEPGVLDEIVLANSAWASAEPGRKAQYWAGRANSLAEDARRAKVRAAAERAKGDVAFSYSDAHGCLHHIGSDGLERDRFRSFANCTKKRLGLS